MSEFRWVTPDYAVSAQISVEDVAKAKAMGFQTLVNNRPDGEAPDQPAGADIEAAALPVGMQYRSIAFAGRPPPAAVTATAEIIERAARPVLAYCRTGTRSIMAWALAEALTGTHRPGEIVALAAKAGYDLNPIKGALETLAPKG